MRLGLSCVVNRNRKVGANSPGASGTITRQRRPCPWWGPGKGRAGREEEAGPQLRLHQPSPRAGDMLLPDEFKQEGDRCKDKLQGGRENEPKATNPRTLNKKRFLLWFLCCWGLILSKGPGQGRDVGWGLSFWVHPNGSMNGLVPLSQREDLELSFFFLNSNIGFLFFRIKYVNNGTFF